MKNMMFSGNENIDYSQSTQKIFGSRKIFLLIISILAAVSDFALMIVFAIAGHGGLAIPIILLILDILFIVGICLSNFRFKYSIGVWVIYLVLSLVVTSILAVLNSSDNYIMTDTAKYLNIFAHLVLYLAIIFAGIYPLFKKNRKLQAAMVTAVIIAVVLVGAFSVFFSINGYFGQGFVGESRVVGYTLDESTDTYVATSIKRGRSRNVVIPEEFNGKEVTGVSCAIFTDGSIEKVDIQSNEEIKFYNIDRLGDINENLKIGVDKKQIDVYRNEFLTPSFGSIEEPYRKLSNCLYPIHLDEGERYITFKYLDAPINGEIVPTWIGKAGDKFQLDFADINYFEHSDEKDVKDLVWCFDNNDKKILSGDILKYAGNEITDNIDKLAITFDSIYKVEIANDNDEVYESPDELKYTKIDDTTYFCRYVTLSNADSLLKEFSRDGFSIKWYYYNANGNNYALSNLSERLATLSSSSITIVPEWSLNKPTDVAINFEGKTSFVYGDDIKMVAEAKAPFEGCDLQYVWTYLGDVDNKDVIEDYGVYSITNAYPQSGTFILQVIAYSETTTSLVSDKALTFKELTVGKKPLNFTWQQPQDMVYDSQVKTMQYAVGDGELINGDTLTDNISLLNISKTDAGTYTAVVELKQALGDKYEINSGNTFVYTISRRPTQVTWTVGDYTYDGNSHNPQADAKDVNNSNLDLSLSSARTNAGKYTASATCSDGNYTLTNATCEFEIKQKSVTVNWESRGFVYTGFAQYPKVASIDGLVGSDNINSQFIYTDYSSNVDAGEGYTVKVQLPASSNYKFDSEQTTSYNIAKQTLHIRTVANDKVYDGLTNKFDFEVVSGLASVHNKNSLGVATYSGDGVSAADVGKYSVTAALPLNNVTKNYNIVYENATFNIVKANITLTWSSVYVGKDAVVPPVVTSKLPTGIQLGDYVYKDVFGRVIESVPYENGTYSVEVSVTSKNYNVTNTRINFTVNVKEEVQSGEVA